MIGDNDQDLLSWRAVVFKTTASRRRRRSFQQRDRDLPCRMSDKHTAREQARLDRTRHRVSSTTAAVSTRRRTSNKLRLTSTSRWSAMQKVPSSLVTIMNVSLKKIRSKRKRDFMGKSGQRLCQNIAVMTSSPWTLRLLILLEKSSIQCDTSGVQCDPRNCSYSWKTWAGFRTRTQWIPRGSDPSKLAVSSAILRAHLPH